MMNTRSDSPAGVGEQRSRVVDLAKGLAIVLIVVGHYYPKDSPLWWTLVNTVIYKFHVHVFFFIAGYTWHMRSGEAYGSYLARKARRLMVPYFAAAAFYLGVKLPPSLVTHLECPVTAGRILNVFIDPLQSYLPLLWFLYVLFVIQAVFPIIRQAGVGILAAVTLGAIMLQAGRVLPWGEALLTGLLYFTVGAGVAQLLRIDLDGRFDARVLLLGTHCCGLLFGCLFLWEPPAPMSYARDVGLSLAGIGGTLMTCQLFSQRGGRRWLSLTAAIGASSMTIYIFHTLFEGSLRTALCHSTALSGMPFLVKALPCVVAGVAMPYALERFVLRRHALLRTLFLGTR
jgi:fucose 4-O-acetylase-like acetyltransferase